MKQFIYLSAICMLALSACKGAFKKGDDGLEYKIISSGSGKAIAYGNYMQIHIKQVYGGKTDSVLMDTHEFMPRIQILDSVNTPLAYYKILSQLRKGDSLVIRLLVDSAFKNAPQQMPPFMKKGTYMNTYVTMVNFFTTQEQADSANKIESAAARPKIYKKQMEEIEKVIAGKKAQLEIDSKIIEDYLAKNNIKATKTKWGTYINITTEGTGDKVDNNSVATVNYTGRTLDSGRVFDSNLDPAFNHVKPYDVTIGAFDVVLGWTDALMQLRKGSKATIYVPSALGYGVTGKGAAIKPNANLVFDMDILDVSTEDAFAVKQKAQQEEMMKKMQESQQNQAPVESPKKPGN